jgi:hypothetical protein
MHNPHAVNGVYSEQKISNIHFRISFFQVYFILQKLSETTSTAIVEDKKVKIGFPEGIVEFYVESARNRFVDLLLTFECSNALLIQMLNLNHLHGKQIFRVTFPHQKDFTIRALPDVGKHFKV